MYICYMRKLSEQEHKEIKKETFWAHIRIIGTVLMVSPLIVAFWSFDFNLITSIIITFIMYIFIILLSILLFNYLQFGKFWFSVTDYDREKFAY